MRLLRHMVRWTRCYFRAVRYLLGDWLAASEKELDEFEELFKKGHR